MRTSLSRLSIVLVAALWVLAGACSSDGTTAADSSTTDAPTGSSAPAGGSGTTVAGVSDTGAGTTTPATGGGPGAEDPSTTSSTSGASDPASSVPIVDASSVEAFCALTAQLEGLADEQVDAGAVADPETLRLAMAAFLTDNAAVIDQYLAAAPPEIEDDVRETMDQTRTAVEDPELFADLFGGVGDTGASMRVSDFIDANCPDT